jgi:hypothetical protein
MLINEKSAIEACKLRLAPGEFFGHKVLAECAESLLTAAVSIQEKLQVAHAALLSICYYEAHPFDVAEAALAKLEESPLLVGRIPRPLSEWNEDMGPKLWWIFPLTEHPYAGSPLDCGHTVETTSRFNRADKDGNLELIEKTQVFQVGGWPGYHTHFTDIPLPTRLPTNVTKNKI